MTIRISAFPFSWPTISADIAADWRSWSEAYRIPMLMVEADGVARPLEEHLGKVRTKTSAHAAATPISRIVARASSCVAPRDRSA